MIRSLDGLHAEDGDPVPAAQVPVALTAGDLVYDDGAEQTFTPSGTTTYIEGGRVTQGTWYLDEAGRFCSFWPPSYRACYDLYWLVEDGAIVGLRFIELGRGQSFVCRYR